MYILTAFLGTCVYCAMDIKDLLWISVTVNLCSALFFTLRGVTGRLTTYWREATDEKSVWRSLVDAHEDEPWRLPRFCLDLIQSVAMTTMGVAILCLDDAIQHPFKGPAFGPVTSSAFSLAIGCFIYRLGQDAILYTHLKHFKVDLVHHLVAVAVYSVFLSHRENALFGAMGLICTGSVPSVEVSRILKLLSEASGRPTALMTSYRRNLIVGAVLTFALRLALPLFLGGYAFATATPLVMSVPVVAFFFTSLMFFGAINVWLCVVSVLAIHRLKRRTKKDTFVRALEGGSGVTFPTASRQQGPILAKKNAISRLAPCANVNLAPVTAKVCNNYSSLNNYNKVPVNEALAYLPRPWDIIADDASQSSVSSRSSGEMMIVPVGEGGDLGRERSVRFSVPRSQLAQTIMTTRTGTIDMPTAQQTTRLHPPSILRRPEQAIGALVSSHSDLPTRIASVTTPSSTVTTSSQATPSTTANVTSPVTSSIQSLRTQAGVANGAAISETSSLPRWPDPVEHSLTTDHSKAHHQPFNRSLQNTTDHVRSGSRPPPLEICRASPPPSSLTPSSSSSLPPSSPSSLPPSSPNSMPTSRRNSMPDHIHCRRFSEGSSPVTVGYRSHRRSRPLSWTDTETY